MKLNVKKFKKGMKQFSKLLLIFTVVILLSSGCFADSLLTRIVNDTSRQLCRVSGDVSSFSTSVCNPCSMTYSIVGVETVQLFCASKWLFCNPKNTNINKWYQRAKYTGYVRSLLCISYCIYGLYPANQIDTKTSASYYLLSLTF